MTKHKSPDRYYVGQVVAFVLDAETGHEQHNGRLTRVIGPQVWGTYRCSDPSRPCRGAKTQSSWRYTVESPYGGPWHVAEYMLRPVHDEKLSTWTKFVKKIGIDPRVPVKAKAKQSSRKTEA